MEKKTLESLLLRLQSLIKVRDNFKAQNKAFESFKGDHRLRKGYDLALEQYNKRIKAYETEIKAYGSGTLTKVTATLIKGEGEFAKVNVTYANLSSDPERCEKEVKMLLSLDKRIRLDYLINLKIETIETGKLILT